MVNHNIINSNSNSNNSNYLITFDASKNEMFNVFENFKTIYRKLKVNWKIEINEKEITKDTLKHTNLFIISGPQDKFTEDEFKIIKDYVDNGGKTIILLAEGGENNFNTNINFFLEDYGMTINNDSVIRTQYYKYFHPKECMISGGIVCETMWTSIIKQTKHEAAFDFSDAKLKIKFVYPYGATLNVANPSNILLTTGSVAYPFHRPIAGYYTNEMDGKIIACGSGHMFDDKYIADETNLLIWDFLLKILLATNSKTNSDQSHISLELNSHDLGDIEINDNRLIPDTIFLAEQPKMCLLESLDCDISADYKKLFYTPLYSINNDLLRNVMDVYAKLLVQYEPLKIIKPQFEIPLPPLQLAVFQPIYSDVQSHALELFDLDEAFSSERTQITQLTDKCLAIAEEKPSSSASTSWSKQDARIAFEEKALEYFIGECGRILNINQNNDNMTVKEILYNVCINIAQYKKLDRE